MNIPPALGPLLATAGHTCRHASDIGMSRASDSAMLSEAKARGECIITHDLDYAQLLAFSGDSRPSVITFRLRRADARLVKVDEYVETRALKRNALFHQLLQALIELAPPGSEERSLLESISNHISARPISAEERQGSMFRT